MDSTLPLPDYDYFANHGYIVLFDALTPLKLSREVDWETWNDSLRQGLKAVDRRLWPILQGFLKQPHPDMDDEEIATIVCLTYGHLRCYPAQEFIDKCRRNIEEHSRDYDHLCRIGNGLIRRALGPTSFSMVAKTFDFKETYSKLEQIYNSSSFRRTMRLYKKWTEITFGNDETAHDFLNRFQSALGSLEMGIRPRSPHTVFRQFMIAIYHHRDSSRFIETFEVRKFDDYTMEDVYSHFEDFFTE
ncbi:hypothetical protein N7486_004059 [Penicillium sp. IBT 16267x]|nr:hypothetical protein N7486_004059 [Penicillium sp. IBT 16267x]